MLALDFKDYTLGALFSLKPEVALAYFKAKGLKPTFDWREMLRDEHSAAFTVAKMMDLDLLADTRFAVDKALEEGQSIGEFRKELGAHLQAKGWWGKKSLIDPQTGKEVKTQLGSAHRLNLIYRTNLQAAYAVGHWDVIQRNAAIAPYLLYDAVDDHRTRPAHAAMDNTCLPVDHPFWRFAYPPNGFSCRCAVIQLDPDQMESLGITPSPEPQINYKPWHNPRTGKTEQVPENIDPGWDYNPGLARMEHLKEVYKEKAEALPEGMQAALAAGTRQAPPPEPLTPDQARDKGRILRERIQSRITNPPGKLYQKSFQEALFQELDRLGVKRGRRAKIKNSGEGADLIAQASALYPASWVEQTDKKGDLQAFFDTSRGFQVTLEEPGTHTLPIVGPIEFKKGDGIIVADKHRTAVHEFAHRIQNAIPQLDDYFQELHIDRTFGDPLIRLSKLLSDPRYRDDEKTREDDYITPYFGKEYPPDPLIYIGKTGALEVMTMSFEILLGDQDQVSEWEFFDFKDRDTHLFDFALGLLAHYDPKP